MKTLITKISTYLFAVILLVPVIIDDAAARGGMGGGGGSDLTAVRVSGDVLVSPGNSKWNSASAASYSLSYVDVTEGMGGGGMGGGMGGGGDSGTGGTMTVKAIHNGSDIAFLITWNDATQSTTVNGVEDFSDRGGIMFDAGGMMCNMGSQSSPVNVWFWHAASGAVQNVIAGGLGTITKTGDDNISAISNHTGSQWQLVLSRPLASLDLNNQVDIAPGGSYTVAFAKWDGDNRERNGKKWITGRKTLSVQN